MMLRESLKWNEDYLRVARRLCIRGLLNDKNGYRHEYYQLLEKLRNVLQIAIKDLIVETALVYQVISKFKKGLRMEVSGNF